MKSPAFPLGRGGEFRTLDKSDAEGGQPIARLVHRGAADADRQRDGATGILDDGDVVAETGCILRRPCDANVRREAAQELCAKSPLAQPAVQTRGGEVIVFEERRIAVERDPAALSDDEFNACLIDIRMDVRFIVAGDTVIWP
jgi:hypothetical protein